MPLTATFIRQCTDVLPLSTMMAKAQRATMMATARLATTTMAKMRRAMEQQETMATRMATGNDNTDNGGDATGDGATGDDDDDDCNERR